MNVLFITSWYPTPKNPNFGIFVKEHAKAIQTAGNQLLVLSIITEKSKKTFEINTCDFTDEYGIKTVQVIISSVFADILHYILPLQYLLLLQVYNKKIVKEYTPDIIHSNVIFPSGILGHKLATKLKIPHIITEHWSRIGKLLRKPILSSKAVNAYLNADRILPVSEFQLNRIHQLIPVIPFTKFSVVGNVVDNNLFNFKEKTRITGEIHFCAIATWNIKKIPDKKPEVFIEALGLLQKQIDQKIKLNMIGGGDNIVNLTKLCQAKGVSVSFSGYLQKSEIVKSLHNADFFIHASTIETFGVVVAEALLTGTPVLCSNVGALPELINSTNGILCGNTTNEWVKSLHKLIEIDFDCKLISESAKNKYSYESIGNQINHIYLSILK